MKQNRNITVILSCSCFWCSDFNFWLSHSSPKSHPIGLVMLPFMGEEAHPFNWEDKIHLWSLNISEKCTRWTHVANLYCAWMSFILWSSFIYKWVTAYMYHCFCESLKPGDEKHSAYSEEVNRWQMIASSSGFPAPTWIYCGNDKGILNSSSLQAPIPKVQQPSLS